MIYLTIITKKPSNVFLLFLLCFPFFLSAQTGTIRGKVVDASTGKALMGTSIQVVGTNTGAITDENGEFAIANQKTPIDVEATYVGYDKKTLTITNYNPRFKCRIV